MIDYLKEKKYKNEKYSIVAPKRIEKNRRLYAEYGKNWLRREIGHRFNMLVVNCTVCHQIISPIYDHDYQDNLGYKVDRLVVITVTLVTVFIILPTLYILFKIWLKVMECMCFVICCCSNETDEVEVSIEEMEKL